MRWLAGRLLLLAIASVAVVGPAPPDAAAAAERGWTYLIDKLVADGVPRAQARRVLGDPRVPAFTGLDFGLHPRESPRLYRGYRSRSSIVAARRCRVRYSAEFEGAARRYGVPASILAAIFHVETRCGENKGRDVVLYRLARLAMAAEPGNVERNIRRHRKGKPRSEWPEVAARTRERAAYLEDTFYPEVLASFRIGDKLGIDPLDIIGSKAGAFGIPQFLPSSYLRFAVDANENGTVSLHEPADAAASAASFLVGHGWRTGISRAEKRSVLWGYNRSDAYIETILFLSDQIERIRN